jgi:hypothetical protein
MSDMGLSEGENGDVADNEQYAVSFEKVDEVVR